MSCKNTSTILLGESACSTTGKSALYSVLFAEVGLACETKYNGEASKSTSIVLLKTFVTRLLLCWLGLGTRLVDNKIIVAE